MGKGSGPTSIRFHGSPESGGEQNHCRDSQGLAAPLRRSTNTYRYPRDIHLRGYPLHLSGGLTAGIGPILGPFDTAKPQRAPTQQ